METLETPLDPPLVRTYSLIVDNIASINFCNMLRLHQKLVPEHQEFFLQARKHAGISQETTYLPDNEVQH